jgi:flagellar biosynthesis/type III secretory pathway protein FliH
MIQEINAIALATAAEAVVGQDKALEIAKLYRLLDDAMFAGFELGKAEAQKEVDQKISDGFDTGYECGEEAGHDAGYDDGYLDGVRDVRANPAIADFAVANIIAAREVTDDQPDLFDGEEDDDYETGCGDPYCHICGNPPEDFWQD